MQRIMIVGQPGSGKSTLALGRKTGLPVYHIHWQPGWVERARDQKTLLYHKVEAGPAWIFEGGHSATWHNWLARADMLIWLDLPIGLRFWRIVKRTIQYHGRDRPDLPEGCREGFHHETLPFWRFIWRTRDRSRQNLQRLWDYVPAAKARVHLTDPKAIRAFLKSDLPK
jgi:adenylate kinase family enzyme